MHPMLASLLALSEPTTIFQAGCRIGASHEVNSPNAAFWTFPSKEIVQHVSTTRDRANDLTLFADNRVLLENKEPIHGQRSGPRKQRSSKAEKRQGRLESGANGRVTGQEFRGFHTEEMTATDARRKRRPETKSRPCAACWAASASSWNGRPRHADGQMPGRMTDAVARRHFKSVSVIDPRDRPPRRPVDPQAPSPGLCAPARTVAD